MLQLFTTPSCSRLVAPALGLVAVFTVAVFPWAAQASPKILGPAVSASEQGELTAADELFAKTPTTSSEFRIAFRESQKVLYRKSAWDRFFGAATFYRKNMNLFFEPEALSLEILALIKHCQFDVAAQLIGLQSAMVASLEKPEKEDIKMFVARESAELGGISQFNIKLGNFKNQLASFEELLLLQKQMPHAVNTDAVKQKTKAFTRDLEWNISGEARDKLLKGAVNNIKSLRVYVKNKCSSLPAVAGNQ